MTDAPLRHHVIVEAPPRLNVHTRNAFRSVLNGHLETLDGEGSLLEVDFAKTEWVDTIGMALLASTMEGAAERGIRVSLANVNEEIMRSLRLARLDLPFGLGDVDE